MYTNVPGKSPSAPVATLSRGASLAILAIGYGWVTPVFSQTSPNWGGVSPQTAPGVPATTSPSAWARPSPPTPRRSSQLRSKVESIPPALAEILKRPDTDVIALTNGQNKTVKEIRAEVNARQEVVKALQTGEVPAGRKRVRLAVSRSPQHDELLNASKLMREAARREAGAAPAPPGTTSQSQPGASPWGAPRTTAAVGAPQDPAAAWATAGSTPNVHSGRQQGGASGVPGSATEPHSGIGYASMPQSGAVLARSTKPEFTGVSQQPSAAFIAQSTPPGIAIVNGHSKGVQFTPGGLYTIIGSGFGGTVGSVDLVGPHLTGGRLGLQVTQWGERQLQAQLPESVSGVADQPVTLRVTTRTGTLFTKDVQFYAARQAITLSGGDLDLSQAFELTLGAPNDWDRTLTEDGSITRTRSGKNIDCPSVGKDTLRTKFPPGWVLAEVAVNSWLPTRGTPDKDLFGQGGDTVVSGTYNITQIPAGLEVQWGVLRSHSTNGFSLSLVPKFSGDDFGWTGNDGCVSSYAIELTLVGPAGMRPF